MGVREMHEAMTRLHDERPKEVRSIRTHGVDQTQINVSRNPTYKTWPRNSRVLDDEHQDRARSPSVVRVSTLGPGDLDCDRSGVDNHRVHCLDPSVGAHGHPAHCVRDRCECARRDDLKGNVPWAMLTSAWLASVLLAVSASKLGLSLLRRKRRLVLFLRRFGYSDATQAITTAAASRLGQSWRLVTLDDSEIEAIGLPLPTRLAYRSGATTSRFVGRIAHGLVRTETIIFRPALVALIVIPIADIAMHPAKFQLATGKQYLAMLQGIAIDHRLPRSFHLDANLAFLACLAIVVVGVVGMIGMLLGLLGTMAFFGPVSFVRNAVGSVSATEDAKHISIGGPNAIDSAVDAILKRSRGVYAPRLLVVKVPSTMWRSAVRRLAEMSAAVSSTFRSRRIASCGRWRPSQFSAASSCLSASTHGFEG